jgi:hypothetical protein
MLFAPPLAPAAKQAATSNSNPHHKELTMSQRAYPPPPTNGSGPYQIAWWEAGRHDESMYRHTTLTTQAEAEQVLTWLSADPANDGIQCSWQKPEAFTAIPI